VKRIDPLAAHLMAPPTGIPDGLVIRLATAADMRPLHNAFYARLPYTQFQSHFQRLLRRQEAQRGFWLIAESPPNLIGNGQLIIYPHGAELANFQVIETFRDQGVGTAMIHVLINVARYIGLGSLEIGVALSNERAQALYTRLGFVADRRIQLAGDEPAIILRKTL
jgi:ribosomal protein S18 acetylase RimI-like enzyme